MAARPTAKVIDIASRRGTPLRQNDLYTVELAQKAKQRLQSLERQRLSWWSHHRELARLIQPRLGRFLESPNEGTRGRPKNQRIINATATVSSQRCAAGLMAGAVSPARPWFELRLTSAKKQVGSSVKRWLDEVRRRMLTILSESNFYRSAAAFLEELVVFGTAAMLIYEDFNDVIRCEPIACGEYYVFVDERLEVAGFARKRVMTVLELVGRFGLANVSETVRNAYLNGNHDDEVMVGHLIAPNDERVWGAIDARGMPYLEIYWEWGEASQLLEVKGYHDKPFAVARWNVTANDAYGRSCGMDALGDVKQLQVMEKRKAQLIDKLVNPPMVGDASLKDQPATVLPGTITYLPPNVNSVGFKPAYEVQPQGLAAVTTEIAKVEQRIKSAFFEDLFLMISQLDTVRTATEIAERKEEKMLMLGPALERLHDEFLRVVVDRLFSIMARGNLLPEAPAEIAGQPLTIEFVSVLAQAQKAVATTAIERLLAFAGNIAGERPEVMDKIDTDEAIELYGDAIGAPPSIIVSKDKVDALRASRAQQQQAQVALQSGVAAAQGAQTLSQTPVGGGQSALEKMVGLAA